MINILLILLAMIFAAVMVWAGCRLHRLPSRHLPPFFRPAHAHGRPAGAGLCTRAAMATRMMEQ